MQIISLKRTAELKPCIVKEMFKGYFYQWEIKVDPFNNDARGAYIENLCSQFCDKVDLNEEQFDSNLQYLLNTLKEYKNEPNIRGSLAQMNSLSFYSLKETEPNTYVYTTYYIIEYP